MSARPRSALAELGPDAARRSPRRSPPTCRRCAPAIYVCTSGQLPMVDGALPATGKVGAEVDARAGARSWPRTLRAQRAGRGASPSRRPRRGRARRQGRRLRGERARRSPASPAWSTARASCSARSSATPACTRAARSASRCCRSTRRSRSSSSSRSAEALAWRRRWSLPAPARHPGDGREAARDAPRRSRATGLRGFLQRRVASMAFAAG